MALASRADCMGAGRSLGDGLERVVGIGEARVADGIGGAAGVSRVDGARADGCYRTAVRAAGKRPLIIPSPSSPLQVKNHSFTLATV
jgi:hypothetical protein